ncbi:WD repeat- and FYVE domain-containing protein 4 isoform X4 [Falco biarmicus]|uniref:WD repeat- and FYVE domain-containing protein 4 isoform X4 n=1 Tax=Falco cherrug TaxID=345164 RepID=UPI0024793353|nr:WD repeat- and FYVE domain-containing protein 4 isoform X4 [Falco cherrug]XP_056208615.1 WD repeat- and FYVE domain-containing protein 4 isoform X4 [Falco biarmicus]
MDKAAELAWQLEDSSGKARQQEQSPDDGDKAEELGRPAHDKDKPPQSHNLQWENLGRQFVEYEQVAPFLIPEEKQRRLLEFLPLFLKAWEQSGGVIIFPNIQLLASEVSKLLTKEIKRNLNGKPAEQARLALEQLLQQKGEAEDGHLLLKSVYLLSQTDLRTMWNIIGSGLPAALMQCLYLFFTFPLKKISDYGDISEDDTQTQDMVVQIMLKMYREEQGVEELLAADKLQSLIIATASLWDQCSHSWKAPTGRVLRTISKAQTKNSIVYLQAVDCIKIAIQNLFKLADNLPACDVCEAASIILCFVKDSYPISSALLTEFENNDGYQLLLKILLGCEGLEQNEADPYLDEILDMLTCLTTCGKTELKVSGDIVHPQLPHFDFEQTRSSGMTVKNLQAFQVLQSIFQKSNDQHLCGRILAAISTIWAWDTVNFFLLEWTLQPINQFTDIIHFKPHQVQVQFFRLVESIVLDLSYVPHEILKKIQYLIKENIVPFCTLTALRCLLSMTKKDLLFSDIFRDSGLLGLLLAVLRRQAKILRKSAGMHLPGVEEGTEKELNAVMLKMVAALTVRSVRNTVVLKDYGMVPYIKIFLDDECYRSATLSILEQLSVINYEEYMSIIVGALCSSTQGELHLKLDLLKSLLRILENPKSHSAFRTCSGFNGLLSLLSDMEGALQDPPSGLWTAVGQNCILELVFYTLQGIAAALHLDPVNSNFFQRNGLFEKMAEDLGSLGCFWTQGERQIPLSLEKTRTFAEFLDAAFCSSEPFPVWLKNCIWILNFLDHMVKGTLHLESYFKERKPEMGEASRDDQDEPQAQEGHPVAFKRRGSKLPASACRLWGNSEEKWDTGDCAIVHPGAVCVMVRLLPKLYKEGHSQLSLEIQCAVVDHIQSLVKSEKSRQVMCGSGLLSTIITSCQDAFRSESHPLHLPLTRVFEKLASQAVEPDVLRQFLWLGGSLSLPSRPSTNKTEVLSCQGSDSANAAWNEGSKEDMVDNKTDPQTAVPVSSCAWVSKGSALALQTAMSLISMTSPRNFQLRSTALAPSFVEFDMSMEGYGCLYLPTLATVMGPSAEQSVSGGIGMGTRMFPPSSGLTLSCWFLVSKFGLVHNNHPVRFLTVVRHMSRTEQEFVCFSVSFFPQDLSLVISTQEVEFQPLDIMEPEDEVLNPSQFPGQVQFGCGKLMVTGQWHHLTVTVAKEAKKNCIVSAYINGQMLGSAKMQYLQPLPGSCISVEPSSFIDVYGYIATPQIWKQMSSLTWRLGPTYLFEEAISVEAMEVINKLGPQYFSNFQAVQLQGEDQYSDHNPTPLVAEEKISFGINAVCSSLTTVQDIKSSYNEVDGRLIAKEIGINSRDNSSPVFLAKNIAGHLSGSLRTIGSVAVGQYGVRVFQSSPATTSLNFIGGPAILLGLIAMARDDHTMYAAVKVLNSILNSSPMSEKLMRHMHGYQLLAYLLKSKTQLLNNRILQLMFSLVGTAELGFESSVIKNYSAFQYVLCNFELWMKAPENLDLALFSHLVEILQSSRDGCQNAAIAHQVQMVPKLIFLFNDPEISNSRITVACTILSHLLQGYFNTRDILRIGLFLVYTLKPSSVDENQICLDGVAEMPSEALSQTSGKTIWLRNQLLKMLLDVMRSDKLHLSSEEQEEVFLALGPDWFLLFTQSYLHSSTVVLGMKLLLCFLHNRLLLQKFKEGMVAGRWLENSSAGLSILMDNLKTHPPVPDNDSSLIFGFSTLQRCLIDHVHIPEIYLLVAGLFLATPQSEPPETAKEDLESMLQWILQHHLTENVLKIGLCGEAAALLLEMVRVTVDKPIADAEASWEIAYPGNVVQFLCLIYHSYTQDPVWHCPDFLKTLAMVAFHSGPPKGGSEDLLTPDGPAIAEGKGCVDPSSFLLLPHPAKKHVWDFVRVLLMDSLLNIPANKQGHPLELLLEASPEDATSEQKRHFQTKVLLSPMDVFHVTSQSEGKTRPRGSSDPHGTSESTAPVSMMNIAYFVQKLVEKLNSRMFAADPKQILIFTAKQIMGVLKSSVSQKEVLLSALYSCLNRAILYCLSRPQQSLPEQLNVLHTLNVLQEQWDIIFATYNSNNNFVICLMYCLCQLNSGSCAEGFGVDAEPKLALYHQIFLAPSEEEKGSLPTPDDVHQEILRMVEIIWKQLIFQRRLALEDTYKMDLSVKGNEKERDMKIMEVTPLWEEIMTKAWQHLIASEKKLLQNKAGPGLPQSKHNSWSESLSSAIRLMPGRNTKEMTRKSEGFVSCMERYRRIGQELYASLYKDHVQMLQCGYSKAAKDWMMLEEQLFYSRGPWRDASRSLEPRWILDCYEGPSRMRRRIQRVKTRVATMRMRSEVLAANRNETTLPTEVNPGELTLNGAEKEMDKKGLDCNQLTFFPALHESFHSEDFLELCVERQIILQEFAESEKVTSKCSVAVVQGHTALEGVLLFGKEHFYICESFVLSPLEEVYCTRHCLSSISDPFIFNLCHKDHAVGDQMCSRYSYHDIKEIHLMRFLLQEIALEIFFKNGYSRFLVFHDSDRNKIFKRFCSFQPALKSKGITEESLNIRKHSGGEKTMLQKWQKREISNFDYLMYLNTLAGRSYNDYMQYPVFPWVLADYHSETLNLTNPHTFRDLSKPMGAQTAERKHKFIQRYNEVEKSEGDLSAQCHYCTHYSSAIIVASYLVRMEPFTQTFCSLQGGNFDVADRMFHSVKSTWESASRDNMSDVRELIPEFFYLPEFLTNANHFELGCMQDGTVLGDVQLPPWADGDPYKFILLHRQALESDYVSAHLHRWIDLIFGYKQHGSAAVEAVNTYHPYFYGDKMDLNNVKDPLIKNTVLGFVSNFGQIPKQLFTKPHPSRNAQGKSSSGRETVLSLHSSGILPPFMSSLQNLKLSPVTIKDYPKRAIGHIVHTEKGILAVEKNKVLIPPLWNKTFCWGFEDFTCCFGNYGSEKNVSTFECMADWGKCLCAVCPSATTIITSGTSSVVCVWELSLVKDKVKCLNLRQALYGHTQAVTCLAASVTYSIFVSGSDDRTCIIWDLNQLTYINQLPAHRASLCSVAINNSTGDIITCAGSYLYLWTINGQLLASVNTTCSPKCHIVCCCFAEVMDWDTHSIIITGSTDGVVRLWKIKYTNTPEQATELRLQRDTVAEPGNTGNKCGKHLVLCRELNPSLALTGKPSKTSPAVTALAVSRNSSKLLVGDDWGRVYCWSVDG